MSGRSAARPGPSESGHCRHWGGLVMGGLRIFVTGVIGGAPHQGGLTWVFLHYVLGLRSLGHDVYFVEPIDDRVLQPGGAPLRESQNARYFQDVITAFGLCGRAALLSQGTRETVGVPYQTLL